MAAVDDFAKLKDPTAEQTLAVFAKNGLALTVTDDGRLVAPKGTPSTLAAVLDKHEKELIRLLTPTNGGPQVSN